jgi:glycosyltransferase involved in cell wall biosynthesis
MDPSSISGTMTSREASVRRIRVDAPAVTIVMPAYNASAYIDEALRSIVTQTLRDVEVIVIDDGSTDDTIVRAESFADRLDITVLRQPNRGPSAARNAGILRARAAYCAFLDADDVMLPELLASQLAVLKHEPSVGLVFSDVETFNSAGTIAKARWRLDGADASRALERLLVENFVTTSAVMAPKACLVEAGMFPEDRRVAEDYELWLRMASRWSVGFVARPLVRYRYTGGSLSSDKVFSAACALEVAEDFWRNHSEYRRTHGRVLHASLARHLTNAAGAAMNERRRRLASSYLARALRHAPFSVAAWKLVVKVVLPIRPSASPRQSGVTS